MAGIEDITIWRDLGIGAVAMIVFYKFATTVTNNAAKQMEQLHTNFLEAYKDNTKALHELVALFEEHTSTKDAAIKLLQEHTSTKDAAIKLLQDKFEKNEDEWKRAILKKMGDQHGV